MIYTNENNIGTLENNTDYVWGVYTENIYGEVFAKGGILLRDLRDFSWWVEPVALLKHNTVTESPLKPLRK